MGSIAPNQCYRELGFPHRTLIAALGGQPAPAKDVLTEYFGVSGSDLYDTVSKVPAYRGSMAPASFEHRYISEEIPTQMVPAASIARQIGLNADVTNATIALAWAVTGNNYAEKGWTTQRLGLGGLDRDGILASSRRVEDSLEQTSSRRTPLPRREQPHRDECSHKYP
jgi:hypothetical protein